MERPRVDYNQLAPTYHSRYDGVSKLESIANALKRFDVETILEVGCGTGRFVEALRETKATVYGVDASTGMLSQAAARLGPERLAAARANQLPFAPAAFEAIYCVNAIHHFESPRDFIRDAATLLKPGGVLAMVGIDPRTLRNRRYYYDYFEGAFELDMRRYPSFGELIDWVAEAQLEDVELEIVEHTAMSFTGAEILEDPFLKKESTSLLALLTDEIYAEGLRRIEAAAARGAEFHADVPFAMVTGYRSASVSSTETA